MIQIERTAIIGILLLLCPLILFSPFVQARDFQPFHSSNKNPFVAIFGLPSVQAARGPEKGEYEIRLTQEISNHFVSDLSLNESIYIDGESWQTTLSARVGVSAEMDIGIELGRLTHKGGSLDGFIENWHDTFNLPNSTRNETARNQLLFLYIRDGTTRTNITRSTSGLTDSSLYLAIDNPLGEFQNWHTSIRTGVKFSTGDPDLFTGSGNTDYFIDFLIQQHAPDIDRSYSWYAGAGLMHTGSSDWADDFQKRQVFFGHAGLVWHATEKLDFKLQLDTHSAFYYSKLKPLGKNTMQLIMGGSLSIGKHYMLDIGVSEDLFPGTGPDVSFQIALTKRS
ncbi:MAG: DUF3187 family protein [Gammaproteobacteria bacterium]|nr:DUF3187 family protein [Gammaproteobacteria bacterium]